MKINKVDKLCEKLEMEAHLEWEALGKEKFEDSDTCSESFEGYECTRPDGHSGFHIAMGMGPIIYLMWHESMSDSKMEEHFENQ